MGSQQTIPSIKKRIRTAIIYGFMFLLLITSPVFPTGTLREVAPSGKPFTSVQQAIYTSAAGDSIVIYPGTYTERITLKTGVSLNFLSGARIEITCTGNSGSSVVGQYVISDSAAKVSCSIYGNGVFVQNGTSDDSRGSAVLWIVSDSSTVYFEADTVKNTMGSGANIYGMGIVNQGELTAKVKYLSARLYSGILLSPKTSLPKTVGCKLNYNGDYIYMDTSLNIHKRAAVELGPSINGTANVYVKKILAGFFGVIFTRGGNCTATVDTLIVKGMAAFNSMRYGTGSFTSRYMAVIPNNYYNLPVFTNYPAGSGMGNNSLFTLNCDTILNLQSATGESNHYAIKVNGGRLTVNTDYVYSHRKYSPILDTVNGHIIFVFADTASGSHPDTTSLILNGAYVKYNHRSRAPIFVGRAYLELNNCFVSTEANYTITSDRELLYPDKVRIKINGCRSSSGYLPTISSVQGNFIIVPRQPSVVTPANAATVSGTQANLSWSGVISPEVYKVEIYDDSLMTHQVYLDSSINSTSVVFNHSGEFKKYFWRVSAKAAGEWSEYSAASSFQVGPSEAMPVELQDFIALVNNNQVSLLWNTATEINSEEFIVEKKQGSGNLWKNIAVLKAAGNSASVREYTFTDTLLKPGLYSYRLKMKDLDGSFEYSREISVKIEGVLSFALLQNYPNPFNPSTTFRYSLPEEGEVQLVLYTATGKEVARLLSERKESGYYSYTLDAGKYGIASGVYYVKLINRTTSGKVLQETKKIVLMK